MLVYHKSLDVNSYIYRYIKILYLAEGSIDLARIRYVDFFMMFPSVLTGVTARSITKKVKMLASVRINRYDMVGDKFAKFQSMTMCHEMCIQMMVSAGLLSTEGVRDGNAILDMDNVPARLRTLVMDDITHDREFCQEVVKAVLAIPLTGQSGLNSKTRLMEYRYDSI